jgi:hypothetical protein
MPAPRGSEEERQKVSRAVVTETRRTDGSPHLLCQTFADVDPKRLDSRDEVDLDHRHAPTQALLVAQDVELRVLVVALSEVDVWVISRTLIAQRKIAEETDVGLQVREALVDAIDHRNEVGAGNVRGCAGCVERSCCRLE